MKAKSYKLKYPPTEEQLKALGFRNGGTWVKKDAKFFKTRMFTFFDSDYEFSVTIVFSYDISEWNDFDNVEVLDEEFGQPYTPFYGDNYKKEIKGFPSLEHCISMYNEFMDGFDFLEEDTE